ncbi:P1 family peptidase [Mesorhizobium sp. CO1-1-7]|uniref:P1 family peptidase n=1 Tax=unclassified Mesorhizobium TaxID=325217 RepID=UPI001152780F|nr:MULTISPECIES: P1 family peptidase [unclassified Mesorhizobium]MBZ9722764.1 P1 family peptidase [Mesorhizobium sp. CO1-1-11]MBZ9746878.1 P1 family peptidase [Mesorhizobium sp. CO1-1-7]TPK83818.1 P1 family peptidase [Mesorhizobium sp. B2-4-13]
MFRTGPRNLITDVMGLRVGNASDARLKSGLTTVLCDEPAVAGVQILGGAPGTRETDLLEPHNLVETIHAVVLSGGSAFGLDAASGVQAALRERGIGFEVGGFRVPIVPAAILFDLRNGGDKDWGRYPPYRDLGYESVQTAAVDFQFGTAGAGTGALTSGLKGGLGSASTLLDNGITIGALAAVNPTGSVTVGRTRHFWAAPFEIGDEFGGLGYPSPMPEDAKRILLKYRDKDHGRQLDSGGNTTIAVIATDAVLTKAAAKRLAISAHDGFVRAIWPTHTPADGDLVFALATGNSGVELTADAAIDLYAAAGATMARAISRGVFAATPADNDLFPVWSSRH